MRKIHQLACRNCSTSEGCAQHRHFTCVGCGLQVHWDDGAADDMPLHCSDCWAAVHGKYGKMITLTEGEGTEYGR